MTLCGLREYSPLSPVVKFNFVNIVLGTFRHLLLLYYLLITQRTKISFSSILPIYSNVQ